METKYLVIFGMGLVAGYLITDYMRKKSATQTASTITSPGQLEYCQQQAENVAMLVKVPDIDAFKKQYIEMCLNADSVGLKESQPISVVVSSGDTI
jgi:hypothetical protein